MARYGTLGRVLIADLTTRTSRVEEVDESVYRQFLGGYGFGAYLMWKHYPPGVDALAPEACFAIVSGLLTGARVRPDARLGTRSTFADLGQTLADNFGVGRLASGTSFLEEIVAHHP